MDQMEERNAYLTLLESDKRFKFRAYEFVNKVLERATELGVGELKETENEDEQEIDEDYDAEEYVEDGDDSVDPQNLDLHVTGQQLCRVAVEYAVEQYGYMARVTLEQFGIKTTGDIGDVVYNMINVGLMAKTADDSREDFDDVFDLGAEIDATFQFSYRGRQR